MLIQSQNKLNQIPNTAHSYDALKLQNYIKIDITYIYIYIYIYVYIYIYIYIYKYNIKQCTIDPPWSMFRFIHTSSQFI